MKYCPALPGGFDEMFALQEELSLRLPEGGQPSCTTS